MDLITNSGRDPSLISTNHESRMFSVLSSDKALGHQKRSEKSKECNSDDGNINDEHIHYFGNQLQKEIKKDIDKINIF